MCQPRKAKFSEKSVNMQQQTLAQATYDALMAKARSFGPCLQEFENCQATASPDMLNPGYDTSKILRVAQD